MDMRTFVRSVTPILIATATTTAGNCIRTLPRLDSRGDAMYACDVAQPAQPANACSGTGQMTFSDALTDAVGGFETGRQSMQLAVKYCQWRWSGDTDGDGICDGWVYASVAVGSTEASGAACPAQTPGGIF